MKRVLKTLVVCALGAMFAGSCSNNTKETKTENSEYQDTVRADIANNDGRYVKIDTLKGLIVYYPQFSKVELALGTMPKKEDEQVVFCAAGAFTGTFLKEFKHNNVAGDHVSAGVRYEGYVCQVNTGCFAYYGGSEWEFAYDEYDHLLDKATEKGGMAYAQVMMICDSEVKQTYRVNPKNTKDVNEFRALCELDGNLCVIDSDGFVNFTDFVNNLVQAGVTNAIYMDMGEGWNYSWWRHSNGKAVEIHETPSSYTTNWVTFYK